MSSATPPTPLHNKQRVLPTILIYPTVTPESVVVPIVSCILGFPLLALLVICCLRRRAKLARERDRRRAGNCEADHGTMSLVRFSPIPRLLAGPGRSGRAVSLRSERGSLARGFPSLELDTVVEERSSDPENTTTTTAMELLVTSPDS